MSPRIDVLLGALEPSDPLVSTVALLGWANARSPEPELAVVALDHGPAVDDVRAVAPTTLVHDPYGWTPDRVAQRLQLGPVAQRLRSLSLRRRLRGTGPVYVADPAAARLLHWVPPGRRVVTHLDGEAPPLSSRTDEERALLLQRTSAWICGSPGRRAEVEALGVAPDRVVEIPSLLTLPGADQLDAGLVARVRARLEAEHEIPAEAELVVGVGALDWWSAPDAFVRVAWELLQHERGRSVRCAWLAEGATERMLWPLRHDLEHAGIADRVHVVNTTEPTWHLLAAADVLVDARLADRPSSGRREARHLGLPVVTFADPDADPDPGVVAVPHLDARALAEEVLRLLDADGERSTAERSVEALPSVAGARVLAVLEGRPDPGLRAHP